MSSEPTVFSLHPLTVFRYCPSCGSTECSSPETKLFQCLACGFKYYHNSAAAVIGIIYNERNDILVTRRERDPHRGKLDLPGGFVDPLESVESALRREVREEVGLELIDLLFFGSFPNTYEYGGVTYFTADMVFECKAVAASTIQALDEVTEAWFAPLESLDDELMAFSSVKSALSALRNR